VRTSDANKETSFVDGIQAVDYGCDNEKKKTLSWGDILVSLRTVWWSNFDRWDPKMVIFLQNTEAMPCGHLLK
jgi:hypothetical protein